MMQVYLSRSLCLSGSDFYVINLNRKDTTYKEDSKRENQNFS